MRNTVASSVLEYCKKNCEGFLIAGDAGFGVWDNFRDELPNQYLNPGINEQATIGLAAGLALSKHKVFVYNIIPFLLYRCYEQVRNDICYHNLPIVLLGIGSGITYAPAGMTHYAVEDITLARTIPNLTVFSPSDSRQARKAVEYAIESTSPVYIRIAKSGEPDLFGEEIDIEKLCFLKRKGRFAIVFHGSISDEAIDAASKLERQNCSVALISAPKINIDDRSEYKSLFEQYDKVFVVEEHYENGGLGSLIQEAGFNPVKIGIKNHFLHHVGSSKHLRHLYGIDAQGIANKIMETL